MHINDRLCFDKLYELGSQVVEPVPENLRFRYKYWRGVHLGNIALNLAYGEYKINTGSMSHFVHFTDDYEMARTYAEIMLVDNGVGETQFDTDRSAQLSNRSHHNQSEPLPTAVVALDYRYNHDPKIGVSNEAFGAGVAFSGVVKIGMLDPASREFIADLFCL